MWKRPSFFLNRSVLCIECLEEKLEKGFSRIEVKMSTLDSGHPVGYIFQRETKNIIPGWRPMVDRSFIKSKNLFRKNLYAHFGCVNAVEFSRDGNLLASGGDDRRILLWNVDKAIHGKEEPTVMQAEHGSNVFALALDNSNRKIFSAGNDDQVIVHDVETCVPLDYFVHEQPVYGVSIDPLNDCIFASACDDGRLLIYDIREPSTSDPFCLANLTSAFHAVMFHPCEPRLIVSGNSKEGVALWDVRKPKTPLLRYGGLNADQCCMSARFNSDGSKILALRRRLPPVLYATRDTGHLYQFNHTGYYNSCTMKSCSFAGTDDQFVLSGSDNFDLYMWRIPPEGSDRWVDEAHIILRGHRSIVNQVRYNKVHSVVVSSGVEKLIKVWSPFSFNSGRNYGTNSSINIHEKERRIYSHTEYINLVTQSGQFMSLTYDTTRKSTREDPRMMAFFDALVQRDIEGWSDDSDNIAENSYAIVSEIETTPSEDSSNSEDDSVVTSYSPAVTSSGHSETPESNNNFETSSRNLLERHDELIFDNSESEDLPPFEDGALILSQNSFDTQEFPAHSTQDPDRASAEEDDQFKRNFDPDSDFAPIVNDGNIIKELISRKHERLRQLAKAHVILESTLKKPSSRKRKTMYSSTSSSESSSSDDEDARAKKRNTGTENGPSISSVASTSASLFSQCDSTSRSQCKIHSQTSSHVSSSRKKTKRCKSCSLPAQSRVLTKRNLLKNFKRLRYEKKTGGGETKSTNFCSYFCRASGRYQHPGSNSSSSDTDEDKPVASSASQSTSGRKNDNSSSSTSSSSSSSSASDSSSDTDNSSSNRQKPRPCSSPNLVSKKRNPGSSESDVDSIADESLEPNVDEDMNEGPSTECSQAVVARLKNSPAFKLSPLIRRIEIERLKKIQRLERRKAGGNHFSTRDSTHQVHQMIMDRTCTTSSSGASSDEASEGKRNATKNIRKLNGKLPGGRSPQYEAVVSYSRPLISVTLTESATETPLRNFVCNPPDLVGQDSDTRQSLPIESPLPESSRADPTSDYDSELHTMTLTSSPGFSTSCGQSTPDDD
ncbi:unnamed protein product [Allacma fusca]|uniref:DDB1- and CUL4-associated factor 5 n=1 Tax=Allacma fusca TaxID=39272 RepID=A0A8J2Q6G2_9HEXA|nr:unnamed protein product [Allacma fusca]